MSLDYSFIFIQESHHLPSSKDIFDPQNRYLTFHASAIDESEHVTCRKGGIITYVNTKISAETIVHSSSKSYLITITGNLVCINVYLPQRNLFKNGEYSNAVGDIISIVEDLGSTYAYLIVGDFNSSGKSNLFHFGELKDRLDLLDWSKEISYTFSTGVRNDKLCSTKLDHVLAKNFEADSLIECKSDSSLVTKGGHSAIVTSARFPHLDFVEPDSDSPTAERPIYLDFSSVSKEQICALRREVAEIIDPYMTKDIEPSDNPIDIIHRVFNKIGSHATIILNQKKFAQRYKQVPGWTKYNMSDIQRRIHAVESEWSEGCVPDSALADELKYLKNLRQTTLSTIRNDKNRLIAEYKSRVQAKSRFFITSFFMMLDFFKPYCNRSLYKASFRAVLYIFEVQDNSSKKKIFVRQTDLQNTNVFLRVSRSCILSY